MTKDIIEKINKLIDQNKPFALATILEQSGSTPRAKGTVMLIPQNGDILGSIGGGLLEAKIIQSTPKAIATNQACIIEVNLSSKEVGDMGMICGGKVSVMLDPVSKKKNIKNIFELCLAKLKQREKCLFTTIYDRSKPGSERTSHHIIYDNNHLLGNRTLSKSETSVVKIACKKLSDFNIVKLNQKLVICSPIYIPQKVYILGAGHVAQPTATIASIVGFKVIIMDDRKDFANAERFPKAEEINIVNFYNVFQNIYVDKNTYIVIITRGHKYDNIVLEQALSTNATYIGMIGSSKKREAIFKDLRQRGIMDYNIQRVHSPIGIDIGCETPEEIALSIVSEMVLVRSGGPKR